MSEKLIPANIAIADRTYHVKVSEGDEHTVRQSVKIINDKITEFKTNFPGKDMQDYISMVLVWFATESSRRRVSLAEESHLLTKLQHIENLVDNELNRTTVTEA